MSGAGERPQDDAAAVPPTFARRWSEAVEAVGDRPFLAFEDSAGRSTEWTYAEWDAVVARTAGHLMSLGVQPGDRVHVAITNSPAFVALWLACARLGGAIVPSDPRATARELQAHIDKVRPRVSVLGRDVADRCRGELRLGSPPLEIDADDATLGPWTGGAAVTEASAPGPDAVAGILFTSGTTSAPKGVVVTQANYAFAGDVMAAAASLTREDRCLVVLPLFHANAQYYSFAAAISAGAGVCLVSGFSASRFVEQAARHRATHASVFAAPMRMILARGAAAAEPLALRHCWYAQNVQPEQLDRFATLVGCRPRQLYGMTETIAAVTTQRELDHESGRIGEVTLGCDVDVRAPGMDVVLPADRVGEITVGGSRGHTLFAGYWEEPETTAGTFLGGRFRTGDLACMDALGRLRFHGRRGDVLKVAGENVSVVELEAVLGAHPGVFEVAVVGRPDPIRDEVPVAYVVRAADAPSLRGDELLAFSEPLLAPSKRIREVRFVDELPRTSVGKVRKFMLPG